MYFLSVATKVNSFFEKGATKVSLFLIFVRKLYKNIILCS